MVVVVKERGEEEGEKEEGKRHLPQDRGAVDGVWVRGQGQQDCAKSEGDLREQK